MLKKFRESGMLIIPLRDGIPAIKWGGVTQAQEEWPETGDYALACGSVSKVIALDIDSDEEAARIYQLAGETPVRKRGSKGFTAFYRWNGEASQNWRKAGEVSPLVELLSDKRLTTIPPSKHRVTGKPYEWLGDGLLDASGLPALSPDFITIMNALYPKPVRTFSVTSLPRDFGDVSLSDVEEMLSYVSSDCSRDEWLIIGMALRDEFGDAACELWHQWSARAASYNYRDAQACWRSFTGEGVTIATLVAKAKQSGWMRKAIAPVVDTFDISLQYGVIGANIRAIKEPITLKVGGLVGEIADWITSTAIRPQPVLSLAAALAFVGMLKGHRVRGYTDLRTNLLIMSLAPTASGKEHPQNCIRRLIRECGLDANFMGEPTSGTGFLRSIHDRGRVALMVLDEIGRYLGNASGKNAGSHQREIIDYIIKTFSNANSVLKGREYADTKKNPTIDIYQPHFCCLGSTVAERLKAACGSADVVDGFLNRWIVLAVPDRGERVKKVRFTPPPASLVDKINAMAARQYDVYGAEPILQEVRFTEEAFKVYADYRDMMDEKIDTAPYPINSLFARATEHVEKLSLTIAGGGYIEIGDVRAAIAIMDYSNTCILDFAGLIADNETEAEYIRVREIIKEAKKINRSELTRRTQFIRNGAKRRTEILEALIDCGDVEAVKEQFGGVYFIFKK